MNEKLSYVFTIDTRILHNSNEKITEIFIAKYKDGITYHLALIWNDFSRALKQRFLLLVNGK